MALKARDIYYWTLYRSKFANLDWLSERSCKQHGEVASRSLKADQAHIAPIQADIPGV